MQWAGLPWNWPCEGTLLLREYKLSSLLLSQTALNLTRMEASFPLAHSVAHCCFYECTWKNTGEQLLYCQTGFPLGCFSHVKTDRRICSPACSFVCHGIVVCGFQTADFSLSSSSGIRKISCVSRSALSVLLLLYRQLIMPQLKNYSTIHYNAIRLFRFPYRSPRLSG